MSHRWFARVFVLGLTALAVVAVGTERATPEDLPYQRATGAPDADGKRVLVDWSSSDDLVAGMTERYLPDNPAFESAEVWHVGVRAQGIDAIARAAFMAAGMTDVRVLAKRAGNPLAVSLAATDPRIRMTAVMVSGKLSGEAASGIGYVFDGVPDDEPGVSAFMAPDNVFVALGGHIIPEVHWYLGTTEAGHDLIAEGRLPPQEAVDEASLFFSKWVAAYVVPLKGIQRQSLQMMQTWNNAMNTCSGDPNCAIVPMSDGSGGWEARIGD